MNDWLEDELTTAVAEGLAKGYDPLQLQVWVEQRRRVAACVDHTLTGPRGGDHVFATCPKCDGRFKVTITEETR